MIVVNSICGCAAGKARPGVALALEHAVRPDQVATVFAGADIEATDRARGYFTGYPPSSPSIGLLRDGELVWMLERRQIENQGPQQIAEMLRQRLRRVVRAAGASLINRDSCAVPSQGIVDMVAPARRRTDGSYRTKVNFACPDVPLPHGHRNAPLLGRAVALMRT